MSTVPFATRTKLPPRWSVGRPVVAALLPWSIAGLPAWGIIVGVGPAAGIAPPPHCDVFPLKVQFRAVTDALPDAASAPPPASSNPTADRPDRPAVLPVNVQPTRRVVPAVAYSPPPLAPVEFPRK